MNISLKSLSNLGQIVKTYFFSLHTDLNILIRLQTKFPVEGNILVKGVHEIKRLRTTDKL